MNWSEAIANILSSWAWPLFILIVLCLGWKKIPSAINFLGRLIEERGFAVKTPGGDFIVDGKGTKEKDKMEPTSLTSPSSSSKGEIALGFLKIENDTVRVSNEIEINYEPNQKTIKNKIYKTGQKVHFIVNNSSSDDLFAPLCFVDLPSIFRHLSTENPESGELTINSDLWGIGGASTELRDLSNSRMEISGFLSRTLKSGQSARFFIRFNLPNNTEEFKIIMKFKAVGKEEVNEELTLKVKSTST